MSEELQLKARIRKIEDSFLKIRGGLAVAVPVLLLVLGKMYTDVIDFQKFHEKSKQDLTQLGTKIKQGIDQHTNEILGEKEWYPIEQNTTGFRLNCEYKWVLKEMTNLGPLATGDTFFATRVNQHNVQTYFTIGTNRAWAWTNQNSKEAFVYQINNTTDRTSALGMTVEITVKAALFFRC
jgi:hypothetical protein